MMVDKFKKKVSQFASERKPFLFVIDFECIKPFVCPLEKININDIWYNVKGFSNIIAAATQTKLKLNSDPINKDEYEEKLNKVLQHLKNGDSYLTNLTLPTPIQSNLNLKQIFHSAIAPYKLLFKNEFVVFSPECFVQIIGNDIYTFPMKGTINASVENAAQVLLNNKKETWEHNTVVDLLRNDLSIVAKNVSVEKFRYVSQIKTHNGEILQTSSKIKGRLPNDWRNNLGEIILKLLPAGSISGAPKQKTVEIIKEVEASSRGYYTGIFGIYDGQNLDSAISIRYIEQKGGQLTFRSGGGITAYSDLENEYQELLQKIYVPTI